MTFMKSVSVMALSIALGLVVQPLQAQQAPVVTYSTDVFQYWHLNGEAYKDNVPPPTGRARDGHVRA